MLDIENVDAYYGESHILHDVSLTVRNGEVVCHGLNPPARPQPRVQPATPLSTTW
jgi:ABC-type lipopolysaccharide export system ATPase subunit